MPDRDNIVGYAAHNPSKHVFIITLPLREEPEVYEDEVVVRLNMPNSTEEIRMTPGGFRSLCNAFAAAHSKIEGRSDQTPQPDHKVSLLPATFTAELGDVS